MIMKRMKKIYALAILGAALAGCSLEPVNFSQLAPDNSLNTESDLAAAVTGVYHEFRQGGWAAYNCSWGSLLTLQVGCTDEADCNWVWDQQLNYMWMPYDDTDGWESNFYKTFVPAITRITALLERMKHLTVSAPVKRQYAAELRTIRAMFAYDLYDLYGPVPIIVDGKLATDPDKAMAWEPVRPTVDWYVEFLETELTEVQENLKPQNKLLPTEWGRVTVGIAQMYLLKLYMHEAGQETNYREGGEAAAAKWWKKAAELSAKMMAPGTPYGLMKDYMGIWEPDNKGNKEVIFAIPCMPTGGLGNNFLAHTLPADYVSRKDVPLTCWGGFLGTWETYDSFAPGDKRRQGLVAEYWNGKRMVNRRTDKISGKSAPFPMKYPENNTTNGNWDSSDYVLERFADVILSRAEALNELNVPTDEVKSLIHQIRSRAFDNYEGSTNEKTVNDIADKDAMRQHILNERLWEFYWEGKRRPDLIRNGSLISNAIARGKTFAEDKHILYCIPQSVRYESPTIAQNPGWE